MILPLHAMIIRFVSGLRTISVKREENTYRTWMTYDPPHADRVFLQSLLLITFFIFVFIYIWGEEIAHHSSWCYLGASLNCSHLVFAVLVLARHGHKGLPLINVLTAFQLFKLSESEDICGFDVLITTATLSSAGNWHAKCINNSNWNKFYLKNFIDTRVEHHLGLKK